MLKQKGFTIVELMIATAVFSIILLVISLGIVEIGRLYYKGITSARTQEAARSAIEDISRSLQLNKGDRVATGGEAFAPKAYCIGDLRYSYIIDRKVDPSHPTNKHALWVDNKNASESCGPVDLSQAEPSDDGRELVPTNMRLLQFDVSPLSSGTYEVKVGIGYGENDLLTLYDNEGTKRQNLDGNGSEPNEADAALALCKTGVSGANFCAVSSLGVVVKMRL